MLPLFDKILIYFCCFSSGIERFRRGKCVRLHVQRAIFVVASGIRLQVQDWRSAQDPAALATKDFTELRQYQVGHNEH